MKALWDKVWNWNNSGVANNALQPWQIFAILGMAFTWAALLWPQQRIQVHSQSSTLSKPHASETSEARAIKILNHHLQMGAKKAELERLSVEKENEEMADPIETQDWSSISKELDQLSELGPAQAQDEMMAQKVYQDLHGKSEGYGNPVAPSDRINAALAVQDWVEEYETYQQKQYVEQFLENARQQGYELQLNDQLEVVKVVKIPTNRSFKGMTSILKMRGH